MARIKVTAETLGEEVERILSQYGDAVDAGMDRVLEAEAKEGAAALRNTSPKRTGAYARSWTYKDEGVPGARAYTIYNAKHYQLTHLLEHGHATRAGGRTEPKAGKQSYVGAQVHIAPVEEAIKNDLPGRIGTEVGKI